VWANHGDDISIQYSGTPALKGDFVRYLLGMYIYSQEKSVSTCLPATFFLILGMVKGLSKESFKMAGMPSHATT